MSVPVDVVVSPPKQLLGGIELPRPEVRRALVLSFWDGTFATVMIALTETFAIVVFSMTLLGGVLATRLPVLFTWQLQSLFLVSALVRIATFSFFFPRFHEYAPRTGQSAQELFNQIPGYRVGLGLLRNFFRAFRG